ncbi:MAG: HPr kinase/phosphorylase [Sulfitobacter sp.]
MAPPPSLVTVHATCVAHKGRAALICGESGSGKSALALQMIALGAALVADDQTIVTGAGGVLRAAPPPAIAGLIEARGMGLLRLPYLENQVISVIVQMDQIETQRLPPYRRETLLDVTLPCLHKLDHAQFPAALMAFLAGERKEPHGGY